MRWLATSCAPSVCCDPGVAQRASRRRRGRRRPVARIEQRAKAQTALALAFPGPARSDGDRTVAELIGTVASGLGGRFFDELRDRRSLAYTVRAFALEWTLAGMFIGVHRDIARTRRRSPAPDCWRVREAVRIGRDGGRAGAGADVRGGHLRDLPAERRAPCWGK